MTSSGVYSYSFSVEQIFTFSASSSSNILNQIKNAVDAYATQSSNIYSVVPTGYTYELINPAAIKGSVQISTSPLTTYYAILPNVFTVTSSTSSSVEPNVLFSNLTSTVCNHFNY